MDTHNNAYGPNVNRMKSAANYKSSLNVNPVRLTDGKPPTPGNGGRFGKVRSSN